MTDFLSKVTLKEYQRDLIPYFKRYQLAELKEDRKRNEILDTAILGRRAKTFIEGGEEDELTLEREANSNLIEQVRRRQFQSNTADLAILYEITGY